MKKDYSMVNELVDQYTAVMQKLIIIIFIIAAITTNLLQEEKEAIFKAARHGDLTTFQKLYSNGVDVISAVDVVSKLLYSK